MELNTRIHDLKVLIRRRFDADNINTEKNWIEVMKEELEKALINWEIHCLETGDVRHFSIELYK
jgi:hypothetical protein